MALNKIVLSDGVTELANVKSVTYKEVVNSGVGLRPGCVSSAQIEVEVYGNQTGAVAAGEVVRYYQLDGAGNETLMGLFKAEPSIKTKNSYKFLAYDNAQKLEADFSQWLQANQANFPMTVYALVSAACAVAGVTLGSAFWPLSTQTVNAFYSDGITCRDILSYAAEIACKFVRCHADGAVYFDWYAAVTDTIAPSAGTNQYAYKQNGLTYANYTAESLARVAVHPSGEDDVAYVFPNGVTSGNTLHIKNNLLLTAADAEFYNAVAQNVYSNLSALFPYRPFSVNLFPKENPFRAGDIVTVTDIQGLAFSAPVMALSVSKSASTLESTGNVLLVDDTNTAKELVQLSSDIVRINKLKVSYADIDQAIINYLTANNVTAQNLTIVDANDHVLATFTANGIMLGEADQSHAMLDYNSFELLDKDGNAYLSVGDARTSDNPVTITENFTGNGNATIFYLGYTASDVSEIVVKLNGTVITTGFTAYADRVAFATAPSNLSSVVISYPTLQPIYHFVLGTLRAGATTGASAVALGKNVEASGSFASVGGGHSNRATGRGSTIGGGLNQVASGNQTFIGGGAGNTASGLSAVVGGGNNNTASASNTMVGGGSFNAAVGRWASVLGGFNNNANAGMSTIAGGRNNTINPNAYSGFTAGEYNVVEKAYSVCLGRGNTASSESQFICGKFNDPDANDIFVEIVGNGTDINNHSNARTLDWSGNETLAGGLTLGTPLTPENGGTGVTTLAGAANAMITGEAVPLEAVAGVTIVRQSCYRYGSMLVVNAFVTLANNIASNGNIAGLPSDFRFGVVQDIVGAATSGGSKIFYAPANAPYIRTNGAAAAGSYIINGLLHLTDY